MGIVGASRPKEPTAFVALIDVVALGFWIRRSDLTGENTPIGVLGGRSVVSAGGSTVERDEKADDEDEYDEGLEKETLVVDFLGIRWSWMGRSRRREETGVLERTKDCAGRAGVLSGRLLRLLRRNRSTLTLVVGVVAPTCCDRGEEEEDVAKSFWPSRETEMLCREELKVWKDLMISLLSMSYRTILPSRPPLTKRRLLTGENERQEAGAEWGGEKEWTVFREVSRKETTPESKATASFLSHNLEKTRLFTADLDG